MQRVNPAVSLVAVPGRRRATLDLAQRLEQALALVTREIPLGTSIAHLYTRHPLEYAQGAAIVHELVPGRFRFGIGVSHGPAHERLGIRPGKPLEDVRRFVAELRGYDKQVGGLPPVVLATLRRGMVKLAGEIAQGAVWANAARSHVPASLAHLPVAAQRDPDFFVGDMIPTCIDEDRAAAATVMRKTLVSYAKLPNYQNYWIEAGYEDEMRAVREAIAARDDAAIVRAMSDRWLSDVTLFGDATDVRDGIEAWRAAGVRTVILVPSSTRGGQMVAFEELIRAFR